MNIPIITLEELASALDESRQATLDEIQTMLQKSLSKPAPEYISRKEVANMLGVTVTTIDSWTNQGILKRYKIGGQYRYKMSEVTNAIENPGQ